jgi:enamine deaminase RidA (YjgF/YER057c/UK114 family)
MGVQTQNPSGLSTPRGYSHVAVGTGKRLVFIAGQVALDTSGTLVGAGDVGAQARQAFHNLLVAVKSVGGTVRDIARITWYVVNYSPALRPALVAARSEAFGDHAPASTLVGVQALADPGFLVEVEAIVVLD